MQLIMINTHACFRCLSFHRHTYTNEPSTDIVALSYLQDQLRRLLPTLRVSPCNRNSARGPTFALEIESLEHLLEFLPIIGVWPSQARGSMNVSLVRRWQLVEVGSSSGGRGLHWRVICLHPGCIYRATEGLQQFPV